MRKTWATLIEVENRIYTVTVVENSVGVKRLQINGSDFVVFPEPVRDEAYRVARKAKKI